MSLIKTLGPDGWEVEGINEPLARFDTDANGNVTGLVDPVTGGTLEINEPAFSYSKGLTLFDCTTTAGSSLVGAGVTAESVAVDIPGYKTGNSIRFTVPVGVTGSITFPAFTARNIKNGVFGIIFEQESLDIGRPGAIYFGDTSTFTTNAYRADPTMNRHGLQTWTFANSTTYSVNEMAINAGAPTPQTVTNARFLVNNTAGSVPFQIIIHEIIAASSVKPSVSLFIDDGIDSAFYGWMPLLNNYRFLASFSIIKDLIGTGGYMTTNQLNSLYADGHDLVPHGQNSLASYGTLDLALADIDNNRDYLINLGFARGSDYYVYPNGVFDYSAADRTSIKNYLVSKGIRAAYAVSINGTSFGLLPIKKCGPLNIPRLAINASTIAATLLNQIDALVSTGRSSVLMAHNLVESGATGDAVNRSVAETILDGLSSRQASGVLDVITASTIHDRLGL